MADKLVDVVLAVAAVHTRIWIALVHIAQAARIVVSSLKGQAVRIASGEE